MKCDENRSVWSGRQEEATRIRKSHAKDLKKKKKLVGFGVGHPPGGFSDWQASDRYLCTVPENGSP